MLKKPILNTWGKGFSFLLLISLFTSCISDKTNNLYSPHSLQGLGYGINSSTLLVQDLDSAFTYFTDVLGFQKPFIPSFEKDFYAGTKSSFLLLPDLSTIELLAIDDSAATTEIPSFINAFLEEKEGVRLFSIASSATDSTRTWLTSQGFEIDTITSYLANSKLPMPSSSWSTNKRELLNLDFNLENPPGAFPRFVEDRSFEYQSMERDWKTGLSFGRSFIRPPNGTVGVLTIQVVVEDLKSAQKDYQKMGFTLLESDLDKGLVRFQIKREQELHLMSPPSPDEELSKFLQERKEGVFGLVFAVKDLEASTQYFEEKLPVKAFELDTLLGQLTIFRAYAHGLQLSFRQESEEIGLLAEKLKLGPKLDSMASLHAEGLYLKYCALCHGENREGYLADFAPSLRSKSLLATSKPTNFLRYTIQYGRENTAMAGYLLDQGGPLGYIEIELLLQWLNESAGVEEPIELSREPVSGDIVLGEMLYAKHCVTCHGKDGEGVTGPALGNAMLLATATDDFLRYAISEGRDSTLMPAFKDSLSSAEIDAVTAFLRSRASGWDIPSKDSIKVPSPEDYVLNPDGAVPDFQLREERFVSAEQVNQALQDSMRMIILDARSKVAWRQSHIPGAIPVPYYEEPEAFIEHIPNDDNTWIVVYCACPHAASGEVVNTLNQHGYKKTAIIDEGVLVWAQMGYPIKHGH